MATVVSLWRALPVIVRAVVSGAVLATIGTVPWALLGEANLRYLPSVPWSAPVTAFYLWIYWRYLRGEGWPRSTSEARRVNLRANRVSDEAWGTAILAGGLGIATIVILLRVMSRMMRIPQAAEGLRADLSRTPFLTLFFILVMGAVVSGVVEEASFRGYMQGPIERRHGFIVAVIASGIMFGFAHFTHPGVGLALLPYYLTVSAVYGGLAWLTNSIVPSMVLHGGGNFLGGIGVLFGGGDWSEVAASPAPLIWETGPDGAFWGSVVLLLVVGAVTVSAYVALANAAKNSRPIAALG